MRPQSAALLAVASCVVGLARSSPAGDLPCTSATPVLPYGTVSGTTRIRVHQSLKLNNLGATTPPRFGSAACPTGFRSATSRATRVARGSGAPARSPLCREKGRRKEEKPTAAVCGRAGSFRLPQSSTLKQPPHCGSNCLYGLPSYPRGDSERRGSTRLVGGGSGDSLNEWRASRRGRPNAATAGARPQPGYASLALAVSGLYPETSRRGRNVAVLDGSE